VVARRLITGIGIGAVVAVNGRAGAGARVVGVVGALLAGGAGIGVVAVVVIAVVGRVAVVAVHVLIAGVVVVVPVVAVVGPIGVIAAVIAPVVPIAVVDRSPDRRGGEEIIRREAHLVAEHGTFGDVEGGVNRIAIGRRRRIIDIAHPGRVVVTGAV